MVSHALCIYVATAKVTQSRHHPMLDFRGHSSALRVFLSLYVVICSLYVVICSLYVVICSLYVVICSLYVVYM